MTPIRFEDPDSLARVAAEEIVALARTNPDLLLCAATGTSPLLTYSYLVQHHARQPDALADIRIVQLDEWLGLPQGSQSSCETYLRRHLVEPLGIPSERFVTFHTNTGNPGDACERMDAWLARSGPIDVCVLGLGLNGHIGFNEPADAFVAHCHVETLSDKTRNHTMLSGVAEPPARGLTLGMTDVMNARCILLLVSGARKRDVLARVLESDVTPRLPATLLKRHGNVRLMVDREAAAV